MIDLGTVTVAGLEVDPYPIYARLREEAPVAYVPALDVWMVTRWSDVESALNDPMSPTRRPTRRSAGSR